MSALFPKAATVEIDPTRLAWGEWCHRAGKQLGEGDIRASYSADRIGMGQPVRKPFRWQGGLWVCTGTRGGEPLKAEAYRLVHPQAFDGTPVTYAEKVRDGDAARVDPNGFYHGVSVRHGGAEMVLCGPAVTFVPGEAAQFELL